MRKRIVLPVLLLSLLTACGGEETGGDRNSFWDTLGVAEMETVLTVNGEEIPAWRYVWWLAADCAAMEEACAAGGLAVDWDAPLEEGTLGEYIQQQALEDAALYAVVEAWAEQWQVTLTTEPTGEQLPAGTLPLENWQRQELERVGLLYGALCTLAASPESPLLTQLTLETFAQTEGWLTVDSIVFPAGEDRESARRQAEETFARLNGAANPEAVFAALSAADGSSASMTFRAEDTVPGPVLISGASALQVGQHSGILETEEGFWILRRLEPDRETLAPVWLEQELLKAVECAAVVPCQNFQNLTASAWSQVLSEAQTG